MVFDCRAASYLRASAPIGSEHRAPYPTHRARVNLDRRQAAAPIGTAATPARPLRWLLHRVPLPPCQPYPSTSTAPPSGISGGGGTPDRPDRAGVGVGGGLAIFHFFLAPSNFLPLARGNCGTLALTYLAGGPSVVPIPPPPPHALPLFCFNHCAGKLGGSAAYRVRFCPRGLGGSGKMEGEKGTAAARFRIL